MDQGALVNVAQVLVKLLDETAVKPRFAMWVNFSDTGIWKLWIVPAKKITDKREFYQIVASTISKHHDELLGLDVAATEFVSDSKPIIKGLCQFMHMPGVGSANLSGNTFNGVYLPEGILIRADL